MASCGLNYFILLYIIMSVASLKLKNVCLTAGEYENPIYKVSKQGQILEMDVFSTDDLQGDYDTLQAEYTDLVAQTALLEQKVIDTQTSIDNEEDDITTQETIITEDTTLLSNLAKSKDGFTFDYYIVSSSSCNLATHEFNSTNTDVYIPIFIFPVIGVGSWLVSFSLIYNCTAGDTTELVGLGSAFTFYINYPNSSADDTEKVITKLGKATYTTDSTGFSNIFISGSCIYNSLTSKEVNCGYFISANSKTAVPTLTWQLQSFSPFSPTAHYNAITFQKISTIPFVYT